MGNPGVLAEGNAIHVWFPIFKCHVLTFLIEVYSGAYLAHPFLPIFLEQRDWRLNRTKDEVTT